MDGKTKLFVSTCLDLLLTKGIEVRLIPSDRVVGDDGVKCAGWFDNEKKELVIATARDDWIETFVHEYCHFEQYLDGMFKGFDDSRLWNWLGGKIELEQEEINRLCVQSRELEADCERRAMRKIKQYELPIDTRYYARKGNAYIMVYNAISRYHSVPQKVAPYRIADICNLFSEDILESFDSTPSEYFELLKKYCYEKNQIKSFPVET